MVDVEAITELVLSQEYSCSGYGAVWYVLLVVGCWVSGNGDGIDLQVVKR